MARLMLGRPRPQVFAAGVLEAMDDGVRGVGVGRTLPIVGGFIGVGVSSRDDDVQCPGAISSRSGVKGA